MTKLNSSGMHKKIKINFKYCFLAIREYLSKNVWRVRVMNATINKTFIQRNG